MQTIRLGSVAVTRGILEAMSNGQFGDEVTAALHRYATGDWGDMCRVDKKENDNAVASGQDRVVVADHTSKGKIYIITEADRSSRPSCLPANTNDRGLIV